VIIPTHDIRDSVAISVSPQFVISSEARNLLILNAYDFKIPRPFDGLTVLSIVEGLTPRNDIMTQSHCPGRYFGEIQITVF
jgi:hypothetical protein